jgi:hypothetical protein
MRPAARLLVIGLGALTLAGCPATSVSGIVGIGGGGGGTRVLVFLVQPSSANVASEIAPAVQVAVEDTLGAVDTTATGGVTVTFGANPTGATLSGTTTVSFVSGVSTFTNLAVNLAGTGYTLQASSSGFTAVTSTSFDIFGP